jgi:hypothetical protein
MRSRVISPRSERLRVTSTLRERDAAALAGRAMAAERVKVSYR